MTMNVVICVRFCDYFFFVAVKQSELDLNKYEGSWTHMCLRQCEHICVLLMLCRAVSVQRSPNCAKTGKKKAGVLKCHITQHGNYARDMQCVSPHQRRPLSMCRTGPQPSTCAEETHEMNTG